MLHYHSLLVKDWIVQRETNGIKQLLSIEPERGGVQFSIGLEPIAVADFPMEYLEITIPSNVFEAAVCHNDGFCVCFESFN